MSSPPLKEAIFDRLTKGDSYFLHQVRKNRKKQYTRRRNHTPFDSLDQVFGGSGIDDSTKSGSEYLGPHDSIQNKNTTSKLENYLGQLKEQHEAKEQWKKNLELQKEKMDDWSEELRQKISQVDRLKEEIKENQAKHEEALRAERKHLETEFNAKKLRIQKKEVSLYKLMEDIKSRTEKNAQKEKYLDLREEEMRVLMEQWQLEKGNLLEEIDKLKSEVKRQEHQIMIMEKKLVIAEQDKVQYERDRKELDKAKSRIADLEESLRRATVEREKYATEKEIELVERQKALENREKILQEREPKCEEILKREAVVQEKEHKIKQDEILLEKKSIDIEQNILSYEKKRIAESKEKQVEVHAELQEKKIALEKEFNDKLELMRTELEMVKKEKEEVIKEKEKVIAEKETVSRTLKESQQVKNAFLDKLSQITYAQNPRAALRDVSNQSEKRITYISHYSDRISEDEMKDIISKSISNNRTQGITSILLGVKNLFLQIIEGDTFEIDALFAKIYKDLRHDRIQVVNIEENIKMRNYPESFFHFTVVQEPTATALADALSKLKIDQEIIESYIQPPVLAMVKTKVNPVLRPCMRKTRIVIQCEMFRFNDFVQFLALDELKNTIEQYFNLCSRIIHKHGGQVVSFREDTIIAYFEVNLVTQALTASVEISKRLQMYREEVQKSENHLKNTFVGIGIAKGPTIEGTLGGPVMKQYTVIGPTVRRARLLQYFSRQSNHYILFDDKVRADIVRDPDFKDHIIETGIMEFGNVKCHTYSLHRSFVEYSPSQIFFRLKTELARLEKERQNDLTLHRLQQRGAKLQEDSKVDMSVIGLDSNDAFSVFDDEDTFTGSYATPHKSTNAQAIQKHPTPKSPAQPRKNSLLRVFK